MATYSLPSSVTPSSITWELVSNTAIFQSPLSGAIQSIDRGGERWRATLNFTNLDDTTRRDLRAFLVRLNGQQHRFNLQPYGMSNGGSFGGTPLVNGASQTGKSLVLDGATASVTDWIKAGDFISTGGQLWMADTDADSDVSGNVTVTVTPRIKNSPSDNSAIETTNPSGVFLLEDNIVGWNAGLGGFSNFSFTAIEDIT